jgi:hypothetical protein
MALPLAVSLLASNKQRGAKVVPVPPISQFYFLISAEGSHFLDQRVGWTFFIYPKWHFSGFKAGKGKADLTFQIFCFSASRCLGFFRNVAIVLHCKALDTDGSAVDYWMDIRPSNPAPRTAELSSGRLRRRW